MTKYERLVDEAVKDGIILIRSESERQPAKSMPDEDDYAIFFNESAFDSEVERTIAFAHEKGHCNTGAFYTIHTPYETKRRCENRAWKSAVVDLVPFDELMKAFDACRTVDGISVYDLADYLAVTTDFVYMAIEQYVICGKLILSRLLLDQ